MLRMYALEAGAQCAITVHDLNGHMAFTATATHLGGRLRLEVEAVAGVSPRWHAQCFGMGIAGKVVAPTDGTNFVEIALN